MSRSAREGGSLPRSILHQHAFWLYGVIVGLAIREALTAALPPTSTLQGWQLGIFLLLIIRFYLGSALYFQEVHGSGAGPQTSYFADFISGLIHFLVFFVLARGLSTDLRVGTFSYFEVVLGLILSFDLAWWLVSRQSKGAGRKRYWALINLATLVLATLTHLASERLGATVTVAEAVALAWVFVSSFVDLLGMAKGKELFADGMERVISFRRRDDSDH